jgi:tRNA U34 5-carboxymethylaminomethyl modifying GTPase MnmE/TrmE
MTRIKDAIFDAKARKELQKAVKSAFKKHGSVNILIAGRSGVGKSTLMNEVFEEKLAAAGQGRPVTQTTTEITKRGIPISIWDTKGLEMASYKGCFDELEQIVSKRNQKEIDPLRHIHVAWLCIGEDGRRVEDAEIELHDMLAKYMPVIAIITKARNDNGFKGTVESLLPLAKNVMRVRSVAEELDGGQKLPAMGLNELVEFTVGLIPEAAQRSFAAAQKVSKQLKTRLVGFFKKVQMACCCCAVVCFAMMAGLGALIAWLLFW